jgi:aspartyl-tRNA(Asn)/glutamyl-tRNA(Gln) amidotransferase subunit C
VKITKEEIMYVADLARLDLDEESINKFVEQIGTILAYMDKLRSVDTQGVNPTSHAIAFHAIALTNAFRDDDEKDHLDNEIALANAPEKEEGSFVVPKVVG